MKPRRAVPRQRTLLVHCLNNAPTNLTPASILIVGGESVTGITALLANGGLGAPPPLPSGVIPAEAAYFHSLADAAKTIVIRTSVYGDFSPYCLRLVNNAIQAQGDSFVVTEALTGFDPLLAEVRFSIQSGVLLRSSTALQFHLIVLRTCRLRPQSIIWRRITVRSVRSCLTVSVS